MAQQIGFEELRDIVRAAHQIVIVAFHEAAMGLRGSAVAAGGVGGSRAIIAEGAVGAEYAQKLVQAAWESLEPTLERVHLNWTNDTLLELKVLVTQEVQAASDPLYESLRGRMPANSVAVASAKRIDEAIETQLAGLVAKLRIYVDHRCRTEISSTLAELEARLAGLPQGQDLLKTLHSARREVERSHPNEGKLKEWLEVLSSGIQGNAAASDLGEKLAMLADWLACP